MIADDEAAWDIVAQGFQAIFLLTFFQEVTGMAACGCIIQIEDSDDIFVTQDGTDIDIHE